MILRLFIIEWLCDYFNTPKIEMSLATELLGILAIGIIAFAVLALIFGVWLLIAYLKGVRR